jgi:hypothetical protein
MNSKRTFIVAASLVVLLAAVSGRAAFAANDQDDDDRAGLVGTWTGVVNPGPPDEPFPSLFTFHADGTALFSAAGPPIPALGNPGHGTWKRIGERTFAATFVQLTFTPQLQLDGGVKINMIIRLNRAGNAFTTRDQVTIFDTQGHEIVTLTGSNTARKLQVEIVH